MILMLGICILAVSCGGLVNGKQIAEHGVVDFHAVFNEGQVRDIYAASGARLKNSVTEKDFLKLLEAVYLKLGKVTTSTTTGFKVMARNLTTTVVLSQKTTFEYGSATETFSYEIRGETPVLISYQIISNDLILK
ncbi:MAG: hypothetical protein JWN25_2265 [Verrucomicrobiales bacterium]|nr:hypothetical protein [Verrucomicrobiales bacterium]